MDWPGSVVAHLLERTNAWDVAPNGLATPPGPDILTQGVPPGPPSEARDIRPVRCWPCSNTEAPLHRFLRLVCYEPWHSVGESKLSSVAAYLVVTACLVLSGPTCVDTASIDRFGHVPGVSTAQCSRLYLRDSGVLPTWVWAPHRLT